MPFVENGIFFHPASAENTRGARSRAGLKPAIVKGAKMQIKAVSAKPIAKGTIAPGPALFSLAVNPKMAKASNAVARYSAKLARP